MDFDKFYMTDRQTAKQGGGIAGARRDAKRFLSLLESHEKSLDENKKVNKVKEKRKPRQTKTE